MFNLAEAWGLRKDGANPCRFAQKYKEQKRERFLTEEEFRCLGQVLSEVEAEGSETLSAVTAIRLLMLTGCRLNEIQMLRWENWTSMPQSCGCPIAKRVRGWFPCPGPQRAFLCPAPLR